MWPRRTRQPSCQEEEIEDLLQEIARLKLRLSKIERRSLRTDDDDEDISDDQISSTSPSVEFGFEEFEDPLPNSSFLPLYDEPVYDVYDDNMFNEVLDLEQPAYDDDDESKMDSQPKLVVPIIPDRTMSMLSIIDIRLGMIQADHGKHLDTFVHSDTKCMEALALDTDIVMVDQFGVGFDSNLENYQLKELTKKENSNDKDEKERKKNQTLKFIKNFHQLQLC
ncbi:Heat shock protein 90-4 [Dendrobium catenatum]|uniref:Heat shock protein 90-4 n=1 Tax=Dendrobium catenatum TaxID=906689 RepID=A0A2I0VMQ8_9ASPA|nr:Heat shock protein 90-4 [Dendrobium catenatum]